MNIFKNFFTPVAEIEKPIPYVKQKTKNELIDEIHTNFYTEVDRLLEFANNKHSLETNKELEIEKSKRLKALGFTSTKTVKEASKEENRLDNLKTKNKNKQNLINAINYFSLHYPNYKFITEESVKTICKKYNLIYGTIDKYIGDVPDKNLKEIESFKLKEKDELYYFTVRGSIRFPDKNYIHYGSLGFCEDEKKSYNVKNGHTMYYFTSSINKCPLEIAAPVSDFNTEGMELNNFELKKIHIPDPVVLCPVNYNNQKHYLILSAWGQEATDELVVNQKFN